MNNPTVCIVDKDLPLNKDFYESLMARTSAEGIRVSYDNGLGEASEKAAAVLLATPVEVNDIDDSRIVLGLRTINRRERMEIAAQVVPEKLIARWASPGDGQELTEVLRGWGRSEYVFKYDWSAGRKGVKLLRDGPDQLPEDYSPHRDIVMEYLDDDPYTYKADLCCGVLLNAWFLRTVSIAADNFNAYTVNPAQYVLPEDVRQQLEKLSAELMRYGSGYISIDMMKYKGEFRIIEINTNSVGRNISWEHFGDTYLDTYPQGLKRLLAGLSVLPTLGDLRYWETRPGKILPPVNTAG
ncbi:MAG TPA: hypothetical protein VFU15_04735 [Bacteroidia bacterium]|nr:hypothetical protein [Bacteroidia bacterium]